MMSTTKNKDPKRSLNTYKREDNNNGKMEMQRMRLHS